MAHSVQSVLRIVMPRRAAAAGVLAALAAGLLAVSDVGPRPAQSRTAGLQSLPLTARGPIAAALGAVDRAYLVHGRAASNPAQRLRVRFSSAAVTVASGAAHTSLSLEAYGRRGALTRVGGATPRASVNRVTYARGPLREWYANGPLGVEQGFDLAAPPNAGSGPLTFAMRMVGDLTPRLVRGAIALFGSGARLRYGELVATDARGRTLPARLELRGGRLLITIDDSGALYPLRIDPLIQQADMTASDGAAGDDLGSSVAVSGHTIVAGAGLHSVGGNKGQGAAYVFVEPPGGWANTSAPAAELTASDGAAHDLFGVAVAVSGSTVVVGASSHNGNQGAAYVFSMPPSGWAGSLHESAELTASGGESGDFFGFAVAVSGNVVVASAPARKVETNKRQGRAYVFVEPPAGWSGALTQNARLDASDGVENEEFGHSVAIDNSTIAVGADNGNSFKGAGYVFTMPAEGWSGPALESAELKATGGEANDELGYSIAISGATIVAGAAGLHAGEGAAYVFTMPAAGWSGTVHDSAELTASTSEGADELGLSVAVSASDVVVGAPGRNGGSALLFTMPTGGWSGVLHESSALVAADALGTGLGQGVGVSGQTIVGGASARTVGGNPYQGSIYVFAPPAPTVAVVSPASGAVYTQGQSVAAAYSCGPSSPATLVGCTGSVASGAAIDTGSPGGHTFTVTATDSEGFRTTQNVSYSVVVAPSPAPALSHVAQTHKSWRRGGKLATLARAKATHKPPVGTAFSFTLNTAAAIKLTFTQRVNGRKVGGRCVGATSHNKRHHHCLRTVTAGTLTLPAAAGGNRRISFQGRLSRHKTLKPGRYSVTIAATNAGGHTSAKPMAFTIVR